MLSGAKNRIRCSIVVRPMSSCQPQKRAGEIGHVLDETAVLAGRYDGVALRDQEGADVAHDHRQHGVVTGRR